MLGSLVAGRECRGAGRGPGMAGGLSCTAGHLGGWQEADGAAGGAGRQFQVAATLLVSEKAPPVTAWL